MPHHLIKMDPKPFPKPETLNPIPYTLNPKPHTLNPKTPNPKPEACPPLTLQAFDGGLNTSNRVLGSLIAYRLYGGFRELGVLILVSL